MQLDSGSTDGLIQSPIPQLLCDFSIAQSLIKKPHHSGELLSCQLGLDAVMLYHLSDHAQQGLLYLSAPPETAMTGGLLLHDLGCSANL